MLQPGKRVRQTINPALALKDGKPFMAFGTPGADTQPQAQLQFFLNVAEFGMTVQQALEQAVDRQQQLQRARTIRTTPEGTLQVPAMLPKHVLDELAAMGHKLDIRNVRGVGSVKGDHDSPEDRRADGRRQSDARQLRDGVLKKFRVPEVSERSSVPGFRESSSTRNPGTSEPRNFRR